MARVTQTSLPSVPLDRWRRGPSSLSFSAASNWSQCKARWHRKAIQGIPDIPGPSADVGTIVHSILEHLLKREPAQRTTESAREIAAHIWAQFWADNPARKPKKDDTAAAKHEIWGHVTRFIAGTPAPKDIDVIQTEQDIRATIGGFPFRGIVDLIARRDNKVVVVDFKTGRPPKPRFRQKYVDQLNLYTEALRSQGHDAHEAQAWFLKDGSTVDAPAGTAAARQTVREHREIWDDISDSSRRLDAAGPEALYAIYEPSPGPLCGWCPYVFDCPQGEQWLRQKSRDIMVPQSEIPSP